MTRDAPVTDAGVLNAGKNLHDSVKAGNVKRADDSVADSEATGDDDNKESTSY